MVVEVDLTDQLKFEQQIRDMSPDERAVFTAKAVYTLTQQMNCLNIPSKRQSGVVGGVTGMITAAIIATISHFIPGGSNQ